MQKDLLTSEIAESTTSEQLMSLQGVSLAKTSRLREREQESRKELARVYGLNTPESLANYDHDSSSWKTSQHSLSGDWAEFSGIWPRAGMTHSGIAYQLAPLVPLTSVTGYSWLPTPVASDATCAGIIGVDDTFYQTSSGTWRRKNRSGRDGSLGLSRVLRITLKLPTVSHNEFKGSSRKRYIGSKHFRGAKMSEGLRTCEEDPIYLNPLFGELVMGYPIGWTETLPSETL